MSRDFEDLLRSGLRPQDPGEAFTRQVMARIERERTDAHRHAAAHRPRLLRWASAALAASAVISVVIFHQIEERRERLERIEGLAAREQLLEALRVTSEKLDIAYRGVQPPANDEDSHDS